MATKNNVSTFPKPAAKEAGDNFRFTYNIKSDGTESLTIRTNSEAEFANLRTLYRGIIVQEEPQEPEEQYAKEGDNCTREGCKGHFKLKAGYSQRLGQDYKFLGCSNFPRCRETAYPIEEAQAATA